MLSRQVRMQLFFFAVITTVALTITAAFYVRIPQQLGVGRFDVTLQLDSAGGLYPKANVTYRGTEVGIVTDVAIRDGGGAVATLSIDNGAKIPVDAVAQVRSTSVIGESYVDFVPDTGASADQVLADGDTITSDRTNLPTSTGELLEAVDRVVRAVPADDLRVTLRELDDAFAGSGDDLGRIIEASSNLEDEATQNLPATLRLIQDSDKVLSTQQDVAPEIRSYATSLAALSRQLKLSDADLRGLLAEGPEFFDQVESSLDELETPANRLLADSATVGNVLAAYRPGLEHVLILWQAMEPAFISAVPIAYRDDWMTHLRLYFKLGLDPQPCERGFPEAGQLRSPHDTNWRPVLQNSFCKEPHDSDLAARGVRNSPCPNDPNPENPTMRGAFARDCGLVFPRVPSPTGLLPNTEGVLSGSGGTGPVALQTMGRKARPGESWQEWMTGLVRR